MEIKTANTILYCKKWKETVHFYEGLMDWEKIFSSDWFVEFEITPKLRLSIADEKRSSIKSSGGRGITLTFEVEDIESVWKHLNKKKINITEIKAHPWSAKVFYAKDPEGHRIEFWQKCG